MRYNLIFIDRSDLTLAEALISTFSEGGFKVASYSDHFEILSRLSKLEPDLIILGEGLSWDSFKACWQLRQATDIPIVMVGRVPRAKGWVKAVRSGADCYLAKPFYHSELVARVKAILRRREWILPQDNLAKRLEGT